MAPARYNFRMNRLAAAFLGIVVGTVLCTVTLLLTARFAGVAEHWVRLHSPAMVGAMAGLVSSLAVSVVAIRGARAPRPEDDERLTPLFRRRGRLDRRP